MIMKRLLLAVMLAAGAHAQEWIKRGDMLARPDSSFTSLLPSHLWTNNTVPYEIDPAIPNPARITDAIAFYNQNTPLKWQAHAGEANFVHYLRSTVGDGVCYSSVGMIGGEQFIHVEDTCGTPTLIHEMGHSAGFYHEQERADRNQHVTVLFENIDKNQIGEFGNPVSAQDVGGYEFASLMHYTATEFSKDGLPVMETVPAGIPYHTYSVLSPGDLDTLFRMYGAPPTATTVVSNPPGLQLTVDGAVVTSPQKFNWAAGSTHTLSVATQTGASARYVLGVWSDGGAATHTITASPGVTLYTANFIQQVQVTPSVSPAGAGTVALNSVSSDGYFAIQTTLQMKATASAGFTFLRWETAAGSSCPANNMSANPATFNTASVNIGCVAMFTQSAVTTLASNPPGRMVTVDGTNYVMPVSLVWRAGSTHNVSAPAPVSNVNSPQRYIFQSWSDGGAASHTVTAGTGAVTLTATYKTQYLLVPPNTQANVATYTVTPPSADNFYDAGTQVQITAVPAGAWQFVAWARDLFGQPNPATLVMNDEKAFAASFSQPNLPPLIVDNAASFISGAVAPGEIVTIFGKNIGPASLAGLQLDSSGKVATSVAGTSVLFDGVPAPVVYASAGQTSVVVPYGVAGKATTRVFVQYNGQISTGIQLNVTDSSPALLTANSSGLGTVVAVNQDGSLNSPAHPAPKGSVVVFYATGEGQLVGGGVDGAVTGAQPATPVLPVSLRIGGKPAQLLYAGEAPGLVSGVLQINATIPADAESGDAVSVYLAVGNNISPMGVNMAIQ